MENGLELENVRALLSLRMQSIQKWADLLNRITGYIIALNIGIWSFFLNKFMDIINQSEPNEAYSLPVLVAALSAVSIGVWRWYHHHLSCQQGYLLPEVIRYERRLSVPYDEGNSGYLYRNPRICRILKDDSLSDSQKLKGIKTLAKDRELGLDIKRIDVIMFCLFLVAGVFTVFSWCNGQLREHPWTIINIQVGLIGAIGILAGLLLLIYTFLRYKKEPSHNKVDRILSELKQDKT